MTAPEPAAVPPAWSLFPTKPADWHRLLSRVLVVVVLTAAVALERIDVALSGAHQAGKTSGGFGDIATPARLLDPEGAVAILTGWRSLTMVAEPLIWAYGWVDLALMVALTAWLGWLYQSRGEKSTKWGVSTWSLWPIGPLSSPAQWFRLILVLYLIFDFLEDAAVIGWWHLTGSNGVDPTSWHAQFIGGLSLAKWVFLGLSALLLALRYRSTTSPPFLYSLKFLGRVSLALRGQLAISVVLAAILLALSGDLGRQVDDVLAVAASHPWPSAFIATFLAIAASMILTIGGMACLEAYKQAPPLPAPAAPEGPPRLHRRHRRLAVTLLALAPLLAWGGTRLPPEWHAAVLGPATICGVIGFTLTPAWFLKADATPNWYEGSPVQDPPVGVPPNWIIPVVADIPMLALFLALVRAIVITAATGVWPWHLLGWAGLFAAFWLLTHCLAWAFASRRIDINAFVGTISWPWPFGLGLALLAAFIFLPRKGDNWLGFYQCLGTPAVLMLFASVLGLLTTGATLLSDRIRPGGALEAVKVRRLPIFSVVIVWGLLASSVDTAGAYYVVRTAGDAPDRESISVTFATWKAANATKEAAANAVKSKKPTQVPLAFVAAAGGGIRAAYWTRLGMDCVFGKACGHANDTTGQVFLASGVSGGALGLVSTRSRQNTGPAADADAALGRDFIAPSLASFLFVDQPNAFLRLPVPGVNRADTLEKAWENADNGLSQAFGVGDTFPKLVLNSTSVEDGCRLEVSEITLDPMPASHRNCEGAVGDLATIRGPGSTPTRDAFAHLCAPDSSTHQGLALSTAALMAARFPYVSPAGGLRGCPADAKRRTFALDGGIVDNSGGTAVLEAWRSLAPEVQMHNSRRSISGEPCIVPKLVVFDSGQVAGIPPQADDRPPQLSAPLVAALGGFDRRSSTPIAQAALAIEQAAANARVSCGLKFADDVVVIAPNEQPGPGIPLGWTLSAESRTQMRCQLTGGRLAPPNDLSNTSTCSASVHDDMADVRKVWAWFAEKPAQ